MPQFYTLEEAARVLGLRPEELKAKAQHREIRAFMDAGTWRFRVADIEEEARRRGMGSDPALSLSDLDLVTPEGASETGSAEVLFSEYQLGVVNPDQAPPSVEVTSGSGSEHDILLDDRNVPAGTGSGSSSTIIGMQSKGGKSPSDSDVKLVPERPVKGVSDSDVRLSPSHTTPSDSDVTLVADEVGSSHEVEKIDPNATVLQPSPVIGSSAEVPAVGDSDSDFELTPSSVIDALQPESGSDFELTALDGSDEFESEPRRGPSDSDVTGARPVESGINLARPSDSGISLQQVGSLDLGDHESIELAPLDDETPEASKAPAAGARPPAAEKKVDLSATALPIRSEKVLYDEDTDFEVDALDSSHEDQTVQLEAASDFDLEDSDSASQVFAVDEEDVDEAAATKMGPAVMEDEGFGDEGVSGESQSVWEEEEATPSQVARAAAVSSPSVLAPVGAAQAEWGGLWVGLLGAATLVMMLLAFVGMDVVRNLYEFRGGSLAGGIVSQIAGLLGG